MREMLFRGKPKQETEYYFFSQNWKDNCKDGFVYGSLVVSNGRYYICVSALCNIKCCVNNGITSMIEVLPETVGQYTGLTDKNGKKIFEGDIVKCSDIDDCYYTEEETKFVGVMVFEACAFGIATKDTLRISLGNWCENDNFVSLWELEWNEYINNVEVIGNIHDYPELLKEGANNDL